MTEEDVLFTRLKASDLPVGVRWTMIFSDERVVSLCAGISSEGEVVFSGRVRNRSTGRYDLIRGRFSPAHLAFRGGGKTPLDHSTPIYAVADYLEDHGHGGKPIHRLLTKIHTGCSARLLG